GRVDSQGKIVVHWMLTGATSMYDPATRKVATHLIPTNAATPYGACIDPFDNIWVAEWNGGKLARFDQSTGAWTEVIPPIYPANFRRGPESDAEGNIWVGIWAAAAVRRRFDAREPRRGRLRALHGALRGGEGPERPWRLVPRQRQDHDARSADAERRARLRLHGRRGRQAEPLTSCDPRPRPVSR